MPRSTEQTILDDVVEQIVGQSCEEIWSKFLFSKYVIGEVKKS